MEKKKPKGYRVSCPYCGNRAELVDSAVIYNGRSYGYAYLCSYCGDGKSVYALCRQGTVKIRGTMADEETRKLRRKAYESYEGYITRSQSFLNRSEAKSWLSGKIGVPYASCNISEMDAETCRRVIELTAV